MKDPNPLDFVFGVVKQYTPDTGQELEDLKKRQAAIKGARWLAWFTADVDSNERELVNTSAILMASLDENSGSDLEKYEKLLLQSQGLECSVSQLLEEFHIMREFARKAESAVALNTWWRFFFVSLERAFDLFLDSPPAHCPPSTEVSLSLVEVILQRATYAKRNAVELFDSFLHTCCAACRLLLLQRETEKAQFLSSLLARVQLEHEEASDMRLSTPNLVYLTASCCNILQSHDALHFLDKIQCPPSHQLHRLSCLRVWLLHDSGEYEKALDLATALTEDSVYERLTPELRSQLCLIMGCCLYSTGMPYVSVDWFGKSTNEDSTNVVSLFHMANAYRKLENVKAERAALRVMAQFFSFQGSFCMSSSHSATLPPFSMPLAAVSQTGLSETLYILASRLQSAGQHTEAAEHFQTFISDLNFSETGEWIFVPRPSLAQIHVQAAHAYLQAGNYQECINSVDSVLVDCCETSSELKPGLFKQLVAQVSSSKRVPGERSKAQITSCFASLLKAVANMQDGADEEAETIIRRILGVVSLLDQDGNVLEENLRKLASQGDTDTGTPDVHRQWLQLVSQVYGNLSVLRLRRGLNVDALHSLKTSLMAWPDNLDSLYNYVLLLMRMEKMHKAVQLWNTAVDRSLRPVLMKDSAPYWNFNVTLDQLKEMNRILT